MTEPRLRHNTIHLPRLCIQLRIFAALLDIHKPDDNRGPGADGKQEWESHPIIVGGVYDGLDDVGTDDRGLEASAGNI